tara:strand:- start:140 stop:532 length:393 start_codon:yes stop_codon:yes gene_type:complete
MSGPWYECQGPNAAEVRKDVYKYITSSNIGRAKYQKEKDKIIQEALHKIIPNNRNDFGSWRGYATFGVMKEVAGEVMKEIRLKYSLFILRKEFTPYVIHYLYKPGGKRFLLVADTTLIGKRNIENPEDEF